ncbi:uncharacterized protein LOC135830390 [Sycon ciliatum]|uniref:uncharacterized protein LOC135830390 n=1 Tax=Sycon ciliatum TaxID=27933 RepID=UPI0031F62673
MPAPQSRQENDVVSSCTRSFLELLPTARQMRELATQTTYGNHPDYILHISDGGHMENLGLLPLLRRQTDYIILADGSRHDIIDRANLLWKAMNYARMWLGCQFTTLNDTDVDEHMLRKMGYQSNGSAPQAYGLKVKYMGQNERGEEEVVKEGRILMVQPRHPRYRVEGAWSGPTDEDWTVEKADNLVGAFTRSMSGKYKDFFTRLSGSYPGYGGPWLGPFSTPSMIEALMADGRRVTQSPAMKEFLGDLCTDRLREEEYVSCLSQDVETPTEAESRPLDRSTLQYSIPRSIVKHTHSQCSLLRSPKPMPGVNNAPSALHSLPEECVDDENGV